MKHIVGVMGLMLAFAFPSPVYQRGKAKADVKMLEVGERVVVEGLQADGAKTITAKSVQMAAVPATATR